MATRNINLTEALDSFVDERLRSGDYQNASEVVRAGLRLLKKQSEIDELKLVRLQAAVQDGLDELDRGEGELVSLDNLDAWMAGVRAEV